MKANDRKLKYWRNRYKRIQEEKERRKPKDSIETLSRIDAAYLAGLIDGEGHIGITINVNGYHVPHVQIIMTDKGCLEWVASTIGVKLCVFAHQNHIKYRPQFMIRLGGRRAIWLCTAILPYLKVKKEQANILYRFSETYRTGWETKTPEEVIAARQALKDEIHRLNTPRIPCKVRKRIGGVQTTK